VLFFLALKLQKFRTFGAIMGTASGWTLFLVVFYGIVALPNHKILKQAPPPCATVHEWAVTHPDQSIFTPQCDGSAYQPLQCWIGSNSCWCVSRDGVEIPNTRVPLSYGSTLPCQSLVSNLMTSNLAPKECKPPSTLKALLELHSPGSAKFLPMHANKVWYLANNGDLIGGANQVFMATLFGGLVQSTTQITNEAESIKAFSGIPNADSKVSIFLSNYDFSFPLTSSVIVLFFLSAYFCH
jgi:hypothetical protein